MLAELRALSVVINRGTLELYKLLGSYLFLKVRLVWLELRADAKEPSKSNLQL